MFREQGRRLHAFFRMKRLSHLTFRRSHPQQAPAVEPRRRKNSKSGGIGSCSMDASLKVHTPRDICPLCFSHTCALAAHGAALKLPVQTVSCLTFSGTISASVHIEYL